MGSVPQLWLKMRHYQGEEGAKGLVTSFFHLLDLEEGRGGMNQGTGEERKSPSQALSTFPTDSPGGSLRCPSQYSPVSLDPAPTPPPTATPAADSAAPSPRSAAPNPRSAAQRSLADGWCPEAGRC